jgi:hypothetical protein
MAVAACTELSRAGVAVGGRADLAGHGVRAVAAGFAGASVRASGRAIATDAGGGGAGAGAVYNALLIVSREYLTWRSLQL